MEIAKRKLNGEVIGDNVLCDKAYSPLNKHLDIKEKVLKKQHDTEAKYLDNLYKSADKKVRNSSQDRKGNKMKQIKFNTASSAES